MTWHDLAWLVPSAIAAITAWQAVTIRTAILELEVKLLERIAATEGDVKELRATIGRD